MPSQLVYGGREDMDYYGDLWLLDIACGSWRQLTAAGGAAPSGRDHHSAALFRGDMVVFGKPAASVTGPLPFQVMGAMQQGPSFQCGLTDWRRWN